MQLVYRKLSLLPCLLSHFHQLRHTTNPRCVVFFLKSFCLVFEFSHIFSFSFYKTIFPTYKRSLNRGFFLLAVSLSVSRDQDSESIGVRSAKKKINLRFDINLLIIGNLLFVRL